jgi:hypothetical protein
MSKSHNPHRTASGLYGSGKGEPFTPTLFDLDCLAMLPDEGTMRGRYMQDVVEVRKIRRELDPTLSPYFIAARLKALQDEGLVVRTTGTSKTAGGWQRTAKGRELVGTHRVEEEEPDEG